MTSASTAEMSATNDIPTLTIERRFKHPPEKVFHAWTDTAALRQWVGPAGFTCPAAEMEAKFGGAYVFPMISPEGTFHTVRGIIKEITPNKKLRFSWAWDQEDGTIGPMMEVTLEFHKAGDGTRLVLHHSNFESDTARSGHNSGWNSSFDCLAIYLEG